MSEPRHIDRRQARDQVAVFLKAQSEQFGLLVDLSMDGLCVLTKMDLTPEHYAGSPVELRIDIPMPDATATSISLGGKVAWAQSVPGSDSRLFGFEICGISPADTERLQAFLDSELFAAKAGQRSQRHYPAIG